LPRAASWSFQQSAEKALKAIWLLNRELIPRTHDLAYLLSELSEYYELSESLTAAVLLLSEITPAIRYPADDLPPVDTELAKEYEQACHVIYKWAHQAFQAREQQAT
jgi:HEPN domain-containing protein